MKEKAILVGCFVGELGWEFMRFSAILPYYYKKYKKQNVKFVVMTRQDRFDIYGQYADIFVPLRIDGDGTKYKPDCFRLMGYPVKKYMNVVNQFYNKYQKRFEIIKHVYPKMENKLFARKNQFSNKEMIFKWKPRPENLRILELYINNDKKIIVLAPRFRKGFRRNWSRWQEFFDMIISNNKLTEKYNFIICGKNPECLDDKKKRFLNINSIELNNNISVVGLTIECIKKSILVIGSQSAIPNMAMFLDTESLMWGHQCRLHKVTYNIKKTPVHFVEDMHYNIGPDIIFNKMIKLLKKKEK